MASKMRGKSRRAALTVAVLAIALTLPLLLAGCGPQTPEAAVQSFYSAQQNRDFNGLLSSVLPANVRRMTDADRAGVKKQVAQSQIKAQGLKFKTVPDKKGPDKATVDIVAGVLSVKDPATGQTQKITITDYKKQTGNYPSYPTEKYKGRWYVDIPLATADQPVQQQPQQ